MKISLCMLLDKLEVKCCWQRFRNQGKELQCSGFALDTGKGRMQDTVYLAMEAAEHSFEKEGFPNSAEVLIIASDETCAERAIHRLEEEKFSAAILLGDYRFYLEIANRIQAILNDFADLETQMSLAVYEEDGLQKLIDLFSPVMKNEMIIMNSDFYMLANTYENLKLYEVSGFPPMDSSHITPLEILEFFKNDPIYSEVRDLTEPFLYEASIFSVDIMCMNVFYKGRFAARCTVPEVDTPFRPYVGELLSYFVSFVQKRYDLRGLAQVGEPLQNRLAGLFIKYLEENAPSQAERESQLEQIGWKREDRYLCACIQPDSRDFYNNTIPYYCRMLSQLYPELVCFAYENRIVGVVNLDVNEEDEESFFQKFIVTMRDNFFYTGLSCSFTDIEELRAHYLQAFIALREGSREHATQWCYRFEEERESYFRARLCSELEGKFLCPPELIRLQQYDKDNDSEYMKTLKVYLEQNANLVKTAEALYIHRSTMNFRMRRLEEMTGWNLKNGEILFMLRMCYAYFI